MENATSSAIAVKVAKTIGCSKFITWFTKETFIEEFISANFSKFESMQSTMVYPKSTARIYV